jgi:hypothetical protein
MFFTWKVLLTSAGRIPQQDSSWLVRSTFQLINTISSETAMKAPG